LKTIFFIVFIKILKLIVVELVIQFFIVKRT